MLLKLSFMGKPLSIASSFNTVVVITESQGISPAFKLCYPWVHLFKVISEDICQGMQEILPHI